MVDTGRWTVVLVFYSFCVRFYGLVMDQAWHCLLSTNSLDHSRSHQIWKDSGKRHRDTQSLLIVMLCVEESHRSK